MKKMVQREETEVLKQDVVQDKKPDLTTTTTHWGL